MRNQLVIDSEFKDRIHIVSPDYFEVLGTDKVDDTNQIFGKKFKAYRKSWKENPKDKILNTLPLHLDIEASNSCNLRCSMCQIPFGKMKTGVLDLDIFSKILDEIRSGELPSVKFNFRGEPLMNPHIDELVYQAKKAGVLEVQFNSNGALLDDDLGKRLIDAGLDRIKFSVDSINPDIYNSIRKGTTYDKTINKILSFINLRNSLGNKLPSIQVQMVYMESNHHEVTEYIKFWQDKVNRIGFSRYRSGNNRTGENERIEKISKRIPCPQLWQRLVVLWDGTVLMCCGDHHMKNPIGNIVDNTLSNLWKSSRLQQYRKLHLEYNFDDIAACCNCEINFE